MEKTYEDSNGETKDFDPKKLSVKVNIVSLKEAYSYIDENIEHELPMKFIKISEGKDSESIIVPLFYGNNEDFNKNVMKVLPSVQMHIDNKYIDEESVIKTAIPLTNTDLLHALIFPKEDLDIDKTDMVKSIRKYVKACIGMVDFGTGVNETISDVEKLSDSLIKAESKDKKESAAKALSKSITGVEDEVFIKSLMEVQKIHKPLFVKKQHTHAQNQF